jgi:hypothetical protein
MSLEEASGKRYGKWGGNPKGKKYTAERCAYEVKHGYIGAQCYRKPGHGPSGLYCKQHAKFFGGQSE